MFIRYLFYLLWLFRIDSSPWLFIYFIIITICISFQVLWCQSDYFSSANYCTSTHIKQKDVSTYTNSHVSPSIYKFMTTCVYTYQRLWFPLINPCHSFVWWSSFVILLSTIYAFTSLFIFVVSTLLPFLTCSMYFCSMFYFPCYHTSPPLNGFMASVPRSHYYKGK